jgi:hypothetical protein
MKDLSFVGHLQKLGVKLALHGDAHEIRRDEVGDRNMDRIQVVGAGSFGARKEDKAESVPRLYNVLEIKRDFSAIRVHTRGQDQPDGLWSGYAKWRDPKHGDAFVPYYDIDLQVAERDDRSRVGRASEGASVREGGDEPSAV